MPGGDGGAVHTPEPPINAVEAHGFLNALCCIQGLLMTAEQVLERDTPDREESVRELIASARLKTVEATEELRRVISGTRPTTSPG